MPEATNHDTHDALIDLLDRWQCGRPPRIVVVGDFMLDRYVYGNAERLSPDAPVPILDVERVEFSPGGASNVSLDLAALRCQVACVGVVGRDDAAGTLKERLADAGCKVAGLVASPDRPTTVKHNFVGLAQHRHPQKVFRVDEERKAPIPDTVADKLLARVEKSLKRADVLCIEDYDKGVLTPDVCKRLIAAAREAGVPVLVDPAAIDDFSKYRNATCITPNRTEAGRATGLTPRNDDDNAAVARKLKRDLKLDTVVLTLDKQGALLLEGKRKPQLIPTRARAVYDVTGAGDVVLAMLAAALANGATWRQAVQLANIAAGLEVERFGVVPIELDEVLLALLQERGREQGKLRDVAHLLPELDAYRKQGKRVAFTNGCFDILHAGHVAYLRQARQAGDLLVVGLNSDKSIRRIKGEGRPVNQQDDRVLVLSELESVDYIVLFDQDTPTKLIEAVRPDALVKGADYKKTEVVGHAFVESYGGKVVLVPLVQGRSTTNIIRKVAGGSHSKGKGQKAK